MVVGLGLYLSRSLANRHTGGSFMLWVQTPKYIDGWVWSSLGLRIEGMGIDQKSSTHLGMTMEWV